MQVYNVRHFHALDFLELRRQRSLQYLTLSQFFSHFLRQAKGRLHTGQVFSGRKGFLCIMYTTNGGVGLFGMGGTRYDEIRRSWNKRFERINLLSS